jgi:transmembrane sensor
MGQNQIPLKIADLILRHLGGELQAQEEAELARWLAADKRHAGLLASLQDQAQREKEMQFFASLDTDTAWQKVAAQTLSPAPLASWWQRPGAWKYAAAMAGILFSILALLQLSRPTPEAPRVAAGPPCPLRQDVAPGADKARITLSDGTVINLEEMANGAVLQKNGLKVSKQQGQVFLQLTGEPGSEALAFNTISTPPGGKYQLVLPDASKVWLNAASTLRLPAAFNARERVVELRGEAYFEVAKQKRLPFQVRTARATVEVLGTHFNVMAYGDESSVNTTLLEGAVKVSQGLAAKVIRPGQQARAGKDIQVVEVDTQEALAWKNGFFQFNNEELALVMRQIERWYDVAVVYQAGVPAQHFTGLISRNTTLSQVLNMLEVSGGIHFKLKLEERRVMVLPAAD